MGYYLYQPENSEVSTSEKLAYIGDEADTMQERWEIVAETALRVQKGWLNHVLGEQILHATMDDLPVDPMKGLIGEVDDTIVIDAQSGLRLDGNLEIAAFPVDEYLYLYEFSNPKRSDEDHAKLLVDNSRLFSPVEQITHVASQVEPSRIDKRYNSPVEHISLGKKIDGIYTPLITVLNKSHLVRAEFEVATSIAS